MRPLLHFTAQQGWINDPHGITVHDGEYHVFFQYVPGSVKWAPNCHWGHAKGADLLTLQEVPIALFPGDGDDGIWSGSLTTGDDGAPVIHYTAVSVPDFGIGRVRSAYPEANDWVQWNKGDVVVEAPEELDLIAFRDPFVFRDEDCWRMFVGAGTADGVAVALSYHSRDLRTWKFDGQALSRPTELRDPVWAGSLWECPQLIPFTDSSVMVSSVWDDDVLYHVAYAVGEYEQGRLSARTWGQLSYGNSYYAPSFFRDAEARPCLTFWMRGVTDTEHGWTGAHSVPHLLELTGDQLVAAPHPDLLNYRRGPVTQGSPVRGLAADVMWTPTRVSSLSVSSGEGLMCKLATEDSVLRVATGQEATTMPHSGGPVRVILDGPTLEISTSDGVLGAAIAPQGETLTVNSDSDAQIWALEK